MDEGRDEYEKALHFFNWTPTPRHANPFLGREASSELPSEF